jgi:hypothetical protein
MSQQYNQGQPSNYGQYPLLRQDAVPASQIQPYLNAAPRPPYYGYNSGMNDRPITGSDTGLSGMDDRPSYMLQPSYKYGGLKRKSRKGSRGGRRQDQDPWFGQGTMTEAMFAPRPPLERQNGLMPGTPAHAAVFGNPPAQQQQQHHHHHHHHHHRQPQGGFRRKSRKSRKSRKYRMSRMSRMSRK